jgi:hypothetical protein
MIQKSGAPDRNVLAGIDERRVNNETAASVVYVCFIRHFA